MNPFRRSKVCLMRLSCPNNFRNCLGVFEVDRGQNRSPTPPANMIAFILSLPNSRCFDYTSSPMRWRKTRNPPKKSEPTVDCRPPGRRVTRSCNFQIPKKKSLAHPYTLRPQRFRAAGIASLPRFFSRCSGYARSQRKYPRYS